MKIASQKLAVTLFLGDILCFLAALWLTLLIRYAAWPTLEILKQHLGPFSIIFALWLVVFFIFDLYRAPTMLFRRQLPGIILRAQITNILLTVIFFYYVPIFGIAPRTILFIYLVISFALIVLWRSAIRLWARRGRALKVAFVCSGEEVEELKQELSVNPRYNARVFNAEELPNLQPDGNLVIVFNPYDRKTDVKRADFYQLIFAGVTFINIHDFYEEVFDRIPISILDEQWFLENISSHSTVAYDLFKRAADIGVSLIAGLISLIFYPVIIVVLWLTDGRPIFFGQERMGKDGKIFKIYKFRSMRNNQVTSFGKFLRKTRLDELPQLWSVLKGEQSLIGPRPERPEYVAMYRQAIPYYDTRLLIKPGLSGWAQLYQENHPHFELAHDGTREKLSYDLYYLKRRGIILDAIIGLKTIRTLLASKGI